LHDDLAMELEDRALAELDVASLAAAAATLVRIPSVTGNERAVVETFVELARSLGLDAQHVSHDLGALRADPGHPGEEAARSELVGGEVVVRGSRPGAPRLCIDVHVDVVEPGSETWARDPWSGELRNGLLHGRGSADMKGAVSAALHALAAIAAGGGTAGDVVLWAVSSEEDGGLGTFAALRGDTDFAGCVIPEPTGFDVACAQAGALTFAGVVPGVSAHAAARLEGVSAIDRYLPVHTALAELERELNADVAHPLMRELELPYPLSVGRVEAGNWSSSVPDRLVFEGRVGVPVGDDPARVRARVEEVVTAACAEAEVKWTGGRFNPGETPVEHPLTQLVLRSTSDELGRPARAVGVSYGADMRLFCEAGIPCVMVGTPGLERAHAVDEEVALADLEALARILIRVMARFRS
jgi:acetylornithine deacetylase